MTDLLEDIEPAEPVRMFGVPLTENDRVALAQLAVLHKTSPQEFMVDLLRRALPHQNGQSYENVCSSCGKTYLGKRRVLPGKRNYCDGCRATGEPAADRARRYRDRKREA